MDEVDFVSKGDEIHRPCIVEERHAGWTMFAGLRSLRRLCLLEPFPVGAENDGPAVVGRLRVSEVENGDIVGFKVDDVILVEVEENDGTIRRVGLRLSPDVGDGVRLRL